MKKIGVTVFKNAASNGSMAPEADDNTLIAAIQAGDRRSFEKLVKKYERYVMTLTFRYVRSAELAEELAQDVFLKAFRSLPQFAGKSRFSTWLYTIVNSVCLSYLRKKQPDVGAGYDRRFEKDAVCDDGEITAVDRRHWQQTIDAAIRQLPAGEQRVITLFYQAEQSVQEISGITGDTVANVKVKLFRARGKLRLLLGQTYEEMKS